MASSATAGRHVVAVPYPGRGHINPMLAVCRQLIAADGALTVTVVVTEEWHALLASVPTLPDRVRFATIPNDIIPHERSRGVDHAAFFEAVSVKMVELVERLLDRLVLELEPRPEGIVVDTNLTWGVAVGARRRIPVFSLWTQPATFFLALYHLDLWPSGDDHEHDEELSTKSMDQYVPCLSSMRMSDLMVFSRWKRHMKIAAEAFVNVRKAQCLLLTSFHELKPCAITQQQSYSRSPYIQSALHTCRRTGARAGSRTRSTVTGWTRSQRSRRCTSHSAATPPCHTRSSKRSPWGCLTVGSSSGWHGTRPLCCGRCAATSRGWRCRGATSRMCCTTPPLAASSATAG